MAFCVVPLSRSVTLPSFNPALPYPTSVSHRISRFASRMKHMAAIMSELFTHNSLAGGTYMLKA